MLRLILIISIALATTRAAQPADPTASNLRAAWFDSSHALVSWSQDQDGQVCLAKRTGEAWVLFDCRDYTAGYHQRVLPDENPVDGTLRPFAGDIYEANAARALLQSYTWLPAVEVPDGP